MSGATPGKRPVNKVYALSLFGIVSVACGLLVAGLLLPMTLVMSTTTKSSADALTNLPAELTITPQMQRSRILMKDGSVLAEFYDQNRIYTQLKNISPLMRQAQVAIEDHEFYQHGAIYLQGTLRAFLRNSAGGATQGGSTLTQQYVKQTLIENALANNDKQGVEDAQAQTITRKIRELRYAIAVEQKLTKNQILERYLNIAYYGDGAYGVEAAARHYFNVAAGNLTLAQSALLAGIVQNPDAYNPVNHPQAALHRRDIVINRMAQLGIVTDAQAKAAKAQGFDKSLVTTSNNGCFASQFPFICQYVYNTVRQMPSLGKTPAEREMALKRDGLTIQTVIDPEVQRNAQASLSAMVGPTDPVIGAAVTIQPSTGLITSMTQSRPVMGSDTSRGQTWINYAVDQKMGGAEGYQAGSTFKPFTAAAALNKGMSTMTTYKSPYQLDMSGTWDYCKGPSYVSWSPHNLPGEAGTFTMVTGMTKSVNTYFAQLERSVGLCNTIKMAESVGVKSATGVDFQTTSEIGPSFTLGAVEVSPMTMASAYATFANGGIRCDPIIIASASTAQKKPLAVPSANCQRVISQDVADGVTYILEKVMEPGGTGNVTRIPGFQYQAGKTGTTDNASAVWLTGYTTQMSGAATIAADKQAPRYKGRTNLSITGVTVHGTSCQYGCSLQGFGGADAGTIWRGVMGAALQGMPDNSFPQPSTTVIEGQKVTVPDVSYLGYNGAKAKLEAAGFATDDAWITDQSPYGTYLGISPSSGSRVSMGTLISLLRSSGPPKVTAKPSASGSATKAPTKATTTAAKPATTTTKKGG